MGHAALRTVWLVLGLGLLSLLVAAGCSLGGDDGEQPGGAADLPGPLPAGVAFADPPADAPPAPDLTTRLVDGTSVDAQELWNGRPVVLLFTASWCEPCAAVHRDVAEAVDEQGGAVALLALVPEDDAEGAREYARELDLGYPVGIADERVWLNWAAREPPLVVLVTQGGRVVRGWPGGVESDVLAAALDDLVEGP